MWDLHNLFKRYAGEIDRALRRRGHTADTAADLTQDTFVRVMTSNSKVKPSNPGAYLHQVARNLSVDLYRREQRAELVDLTEEFFRAIADPTPGQETAVIDQQKLAIVETALLELPEKTRTAFELHQLDGYTISEVADVIGLSVSRTWTLIRRAYLHLRTRLDEI